MPKKSPLSHFLLFLLLSIICFNYYLVKAEDTREESTRVEIDLTGNSNPLGDRPPHKGEDSETKKFIDDITLERLKIIEELQKDGQVIPPSQPDNSPSSEVDVMKNSSFSDSVEDWVKELYLQCNTMFKRNSSYNFFNEKSIAEVPVSCSERGSFFKTNGQNQILSSFSKMSENIIKIEYQLGDIFVDDSARIVATHRRMFGLTKYRKNGRITGPGYGVMEFIYNPLLAKRFGIERGEDPTGLVKIKHWKEYFDNHYFQLMVVGEYTPERTQIHINVHIIQELLRRFLNLHQSHYPSKKINEIFTRKLFHKNLVFAMPYYNENKGLDKAIEFYKENFRKYTEELHPYIDLTNINVNGNMAVFQLTYLVRLGEKGEYTSTTGVVEMELDSCSNDKTDFFKYLFTVDRYRSLSIPLKNSQTFEESLAKLVDKFCISKWRFIGKIRHIINALATLSPLSN